MAELQHLQSQGVNDTDLLVKSAMIVYASKMLEQVETIRTNQRIAVLNVFRLLMISAIINILFIFMAIVAGIAYWSNNV